MCPKFNSNLYTYHTIDIELEHFSIVTGALVQVQRKRIKQQQQRNIAETKIETHFWYILFECESLWMWFIQKLFAKKRKREREENPVYLQVIEAGKGINHIKTTK